WSREVGGEVRLGTRLLRPGPGRSEDQREHDRSHEHDRTHIRRDACELRTLYASHLPMRSNPALPAPVPEPCVASTLRAGRYYSAVAARWQRRITSGSSASVREISPV